MSRRAHTSTSTFRRGVIATATGVACVAALAVAPASAAVDSRAAALPVLKGAVGPGFSISISDDSVAPGKYKLVVNDKGTIHNFHITGPGVDKATDIPGTGKTVFKIKLKPGTYNIVCDAHPLQMFTTLTVT